MKQHSLGLGMTGKRTRRREFLDEMERVAPWAELVAVVSPYLPEGKRGRSPFAPKTMLRIRFIQQWFNLSDPAMEEALHDIPLFRQFAGIEGWDERLPDESTILRFRHALGKHKLAHTMFVCAGQPVAGTSALDGSEGMSAPEIGESHRQPRRIGGRVVGLKPICAWRASGSGFLSAQARRGVLCADLP